MIPSATHSVPSVTSSIAAAPLDTLIPCLDEFDFNRVIGELDPKESSTGPAILARFRIQKPLDEVALATVLHRLGRWAVERAKNRELAIIPLEDQKAIYQAVDRLTDRMRGREVSNALWGTAQLWWDPTYSPMELLLARAHRTLRSFDVRSLACLVRGLATAQLPETDLVEWAIELAEEKTENGNLSSRAFADLIQGAASLNVRDEKVQRSFIRMFTSRVADDMTPLDLAMTAWSFATLQIRESAPFKRVFSRLKSARQDLDPRSLPAVARAVDYCRASGWNSIVPDSLAVRPPRQAPVTSGFQDQIASVLNQHKFTYGSEAPIGLSCIVDFLLTGHKVVIEADGPCHDRPQRRAGDALKDYILRQLGYRVVRITCDEWQAVPGHKRSSYLMARLDLEPSCKRPAEEDSLPSFSSGSAKRRRLEDA